MAWFDAALTNGVSIASKGKVTGEEGYRVLHPEPPA